MELRRSIVGLLILFLLSFPPFSLLAAVPPVPDQPANYVVDLAGVIDPQTEADLNRRLEALENQTTAQVVVLTILSLEGEPIEKFSLRTAQRWALGQKGKDNGVLITVAGIDRKYRIEVGYGLEAILPDSYLGSLARQHFVPNFRQGKYSRGIEAVVSTIAESISSGDIPGSTQPVWPKVKEVIVRILYWLFPYMILILMVVLVSLFGLLYLTVGFLLAGRKLSWQDLSEAFSGADGGGFGGGGGGGFGGGGGGFGGGGGGGFGGGGVSGGW